MLSCICQEVGCDLRPLFALITLSVTVEIILYITFVRSALVNVIAQYVSFTVHKITFELEEDCPETYPTFFIVVLEGFSEYRIDISSTYVEDREGIFLLPLNDPVPSTCSLEGTIFGGNDAGNFTQYEIRFLKGKE